MKKLSKYQIIGLRQVYDFDTVMKINNNIINLINSYTKKHNLKGWEKKCFIKEIKCAFFLFYKWKENDKYTSRIFQKYNILPYDNVMSFSYNIFTKFGSAYIEKRKQYLRWCDANDIAPREYKYWKQTIDAKKGSYFM
tara:strand:+ start:67 stop:480 length:414 start_codon:yes stop_codon:yes gene_type:complete